MRSALRAATGSLGKAALLAGILLATGCANLVSSVTQGFAEDLGRSIMDNPDLSMVRDGAPAYLILIDSLVTRSPDDAFLLQQSATLHSAYAAAFVTDEARAKLLQDKARELALRAACAGIPDGCNLTQRPYRQFAAWAEGLRKKDVPLAYTLATSWAGWIQANSDDFTALADLGRVKAIMQRTAELDPGYERGGVYLYLGVFETLLPPAMGGRPEIGRAHFERALDLSGGENLLAKVMFAEQYGRLVFDRELHDRLLREVLDAPVRAPGFTLMNSVAKAQATELMRTADDYF